MSEESAVKDPLEQATGPDGETLTLRRAQGGFEILSGDKVIISSALRRSERELVNTGLVPLRDRNDITVLLAGLGMGYALAALLESQRVVRVDVVEHAAPIIEWNRSHLSVLHREPPLADSRVHVHNQSLSEFLRAMRYKAVPGLELESDGFLAVLLDVDDGPSGLSRPQNAGLYSDDGLEDIESALRAGGVLSMWSAQREPELLARIQSRFQNIAEIAFPVDVPGSAGLDYLYRARKRAPAGNRPRAQA
jgi:spermidine synthase